MNDQLVESHMKFQAVAEKSGNNFWVLLDYFLPHLVELSLDGAHYLCWACA